MLDKLNHNCKKDNQISTSRAWHEAILNRISFSRIVRMIQLGHMLLEIAHWIKDWTS